jgi:ABC-type multidrug transport system ATPase subunit
MVPVLTAFETLYYSALFHTVDEADARSRARHMLHILGLENAADTWVGNALMRRLSGGEKRRLSVGVALVGEALHCHAIQFTSLFSLLPLGMAFLFVSHI